MTIRPPHRPDAPNLDYYRRCSLATASRVTPTKQPTPSTISARPTPPSAITSRRAVRRYAELCQTQRRTADIDIKRAQHQLDELNNPANVTDSHNDQLCARPENRSHLDNDDHLQ
jgi:hypothetical protein